MKTHISATIDSKLLGDLNRFGQEERRPRSQIIEMALEEFLRKRGADGDEIVTSDGRFTGAFSGSGFFSVKMLKFIGAG